MLKIFVTISAIYTTMWAFQFENCATDPSKTEYIWLNFDMYPLPVIFPGKLHMRVDIKILRNLTSPVVDIELYRDDPETGNATLFPCIPGTFIGSCQNIDLCTVIDRMNNVTETTDPPSFQEQIDEILTTPLGMHTQCPIQSTSSTDKNVTIKLQPQSPFIMLILQGDYMMKLIVKDAATSKEIIGCLKFNFSIVEGPPTPPPTPTPTPTTTLTGPIRPSGYPVG